MIKANLRHQVRQTPLPKWKPWIPLFEAVMNSFQAIREAGKPTGTGRILIGVEDLIIGAVMRHNRCSLRVHKG